MECHVSEAKVTMAKLCMVLKDEGDEVVGIEADNGSDAEADHAAGPAQRCKGEGQAQERRCHN